MKKLVSLLLAATVVALTVLSLASCGEQKTKIGIMQFGEFDALQSAYEGFLEGMAEAGYTDENTKFIYKSAAGETANCSTIADALVNAGCDLILAIATPSASVIKQKTSDIPVVITAVTDPAGSNVVASNDAPGGNITGTSDLTPVAAQIDLLCEILPTAQTVAVMYCSSESNSKIQYDLAKAAIEGKGLTCTEKTVSAVDEISGAVASLQGTVDAIYIPTDNTLADAMTTVSAAATAAGLPIIGGEAGMVKNGALATKGIDYRALGKQTAAMAADILKNGKNPAEMPIQYIDASTLSICVNTSAAQTLGITVPQTVLAQAELVGSK